ncbi:MAG: MlaD family protein [Rhodospirillales bacterium]
MRPGRRNEHPICAAGCSTIVSAKFNKVDWLIEGSEVRLAGIRIGTIERVDLDD